MNLYCFPIEIEFSQHDRSLSEQQNWMHGEKTTAHLDGFNGSETDVINSDNPDGEVVSNKEQTFNQ